MCTELGDAARSAMTFQISRRRDEHARQIGYATGDQGGVRKHGHP